MLEFTPLPAGLSDHPEAPRVLGDCGRARSACRGRREIRPSRALDSTLRRGVDLYPISAASPALARSLLGICLKTGNWLFPYENLARPAGFEPTTPWFVVGSHYERRATLRTRLPWPYSGCGPARALAQHLACNLGKSNQLTVRHSRVAVYPLVKRGRRNAQLSSQFFPPDSSHHLAEEQLLVRFRQARGQSRSRGKRPRRAERQAGRGRAPGAPPS